MAQSRSFRFGTGVQATSRSELVEQVHKAEDLGYSSLTVTDHVSQPRLAPIATLAAMAAIDSSLWLTSTVFGNDYRHPAILASEAATIDIISNGRLELGIGTGYLASDYEQTGIAFDQAGTRVDRLIESIQILKALFSDQTLTFSGEYYTIRELSIMPKPVQRPHPRLLIGGGGKRMLSLAAREADIVGINPTAKGGGVDFGQLSPDAFAKKVEWVRDAAGERFVDIELHSMLFAVVATDDQQQAAEQWIKQVEAFSGTVCHIDVDDVLASPYVLMGTVEQMVSKIKACRDRFGVSYFTTSSHIDMDVLSPVVAQLAGK